MVNTGPDLAPLMIEMGNSTLFPWLSSRGMRIFFYLKNLLFHRLFEKYFEQNWDNTKL